MTLRDEAITHMAQAIEGKWFADPSPEWQLVQAGYALDALLDFLEAHTEEWDEAACDHDDAATPEELVAALRGTTE